MIKKNSNKISGWIILDKQSGITSRQAVSKISKIFKFKKDWTRWNFRPISYRCFTNSSREKQLN